MTEQLNFEKMGGLVPAVIQDAQTGQVLMVGFMNKEALQKTVRRKKGHVLEQDKKKTLAKRRNFRKLSGSRFDAQRLRYGCRVD